MTARRWLLAYAASAAGMAALGALGAVGIVALEERSNRRLGDGERVDPMRLLGAYNDEEDDLGLVYEDDEPEPVYRRCVSCGGGCVDDLSEEDYAGEWLHFECRSAMEERGLGEYRGDEESPVLTQAERDAVCRIERLVYVGGSGEPERDVRTLLAIVHRLDQVVPDTRLPDGTAHWQPTPEPWLGGTLASIDSGGNVHVAATTADGGVTYTGPERRHPCHGGRRAGE